MKTLLPIFLLLLCLILWLLGFTSPRTMNANAKKVSIVNLPAPQKVLTKLTDTTQQAISLTDSRDGETYAIVSIGRQIWMAENLRYKTPDSKVNFQNPSAAYGRQYNGIEAQTACPSGWHLPSDAEWNEMEMALGMPAADTAQTFWRGEHGMKMKSLSDWEGSGNGTNSSGFNGFPSGFYFSENEDKSLSLGNHDGLRSSVGYWSAVEDGKAWIRFLGAPLEGVNRMSDNLLNWGLACRCVKN